MLFNPLEMALNWLGIFIYVLLHCVTRNQLLLFNLKSKGSKYFAQSPHLQFFTVHLIIYLVTFTVLDPH